MECIPWLAENKEWVFSGIGVAILCAILKFFFGKRKSDSAVVQQAGDKSVNINAGKDVHYDNSRKN